MCVRIKKPQRQVLHVCKHLNTDTAQRTVGDGDHHPLQGKVRRGAGEVKCGHNAEHSDKPAEVGILLTDERNDIIVQCRLQEISTADRGKSGHDHADRGNDQPDFVMLQITQDPKHCFPGILRLFNASAASAVTGTF